jgi:hypothetical protein
LAGKNGGFVRAFWVVPNFRGKEFQGVRIVFFQQRLQKNSYRDLKWEKMFCKGDKFLKNKPK